jgi:hypothetical protein
MAMEATATGETMRVMKAGAARATATATTKTVEVQCGVNGFTWISSFICKMYVCITQLKAVAAAVVVAQAAGLQVQ